ncbi:DUF4230 domain-containing protein [Micromonospora echinofusca]|uniref:DUF4230 domain-containing protein n=1 Tax=Micromonospora echinofusca TaxID=47858 RepID=A0ABS3VKS7_MICEH|nr:DUF4230 domain-containing protein [Micromonospora echinofusca]MBO4205086.1 DUF4230 domain-containing protein [Micromonospora echinofusca]
MSQNGDVNQPTREFPEYTRGQAEPVPAAARRTDDGPVHDGPADPPATGSGGARRAGVGFFWLAGALALALVVGLGLNSAGLWPSWRNPFAEERTDRSQPPLLTSIQNLSRYVAAEGNFQVVIDLQSDRKYVPDFLLNDRTLFVGAGSVESYVDFSTIAEGAVVESADRKSVEIRLPAPQLGKPNLDLEKSYVFAEKRGLLNRLGELFGSDPNRQREVYQLAEERIAAAARDSGLADRARENTRKMLEGLLRSLGYQTVTVTYTAP